MTIPFFEESMGARRILVRVAETGSFSAVPRHALSQAAIARQSVWNNILAFACSNSGYSHQYGASLTAAPGVTHAP
jgi:hypothetical protein